MVNEQASRWGDRMSVGMVILLAIPLAIGVLNIVLARDVWNVVLGLLFIGYVVSYVTRYLVRRLRSNR
jgi:heme A synthase